MFDPFPSPRPKGAKVLIIGAGISGLSCAWHLKDYCDVMVCEETHIGGHAYSVDVHSSDIVENHAKPQQPLFVDMGFIVFNEPCYPNLLALFEALGVAHQPADMSLAISRTKAGFHLLGPDLEYSSLDLFAKRRNLIDPSYLRLLLDIVRFYRVVTQEAQQEEYANLSLGDYVLRGGYSKSFIEDHILPQAAAIWSSAPRDILDYPLKAFVAFFNNHGLLELDTKKRIQWRSVTGGSQAYVTRLKEVLGAKVRANTKIVRIDRGGDTIKAWDQNGTLYEADEVVFATPADRTLEILGEGASAREREILSAFRYSDNEVYLHTDISQMPKRRRAWASWNVLRIDAEDEKDEEKLCVSYWMNLLQKLDTKKDYFVTLNPIGVIDPILTLHHKRFRHPIFDAKALTAQADMTKIEGQNHSWFCGAHLGAGFHEDGIESGLLIGELISGRLRPWPFDRQKSRLGLKWPEPQTK